MREKIGERLSMALDKKEYKQIVICIKQEQIEALEKLADTMTQLSGRRVSRNMLIQDAIEAYTIQAELITENHKYVDLHLEEFCMEKFYPDSSRTSVTAVYYNPDSTAGGQLVYNYLSLKCLKEAFSACETEEHFWSYLDENANQVLVDIDTPDFMDYAKQFIEAPCASTERNASTMEMLKVWCSSIGNVHDTEQEQESTQMQHMTM